MASNGGDDLIDEALNGDVEAGTGRRRGRDIDGDSDDDSDDGRGRVSRAEEATAADRRRLAMAETMWEGYVEELEQREGCRHRR